MSLSLPSRPAEAELNFFTFWHPLLEFARQSAISCVFPLLLFLTFALTKHFAVPGLPRYDVILLCCLLAQWALYRAGWETKDELKVIAVFHGAGLALELFKTHAHAWAYPEPGWTKIAGVPLYSGFMYASVASYLCQAWRRLDVSPSGWPVSGRWRQEFMRTFSRNTGCRMPARRADCVRLSANLGVVHGLR